MWPERFTKGLGFSVVKKIQRKRSNVTNKDYNNGQLPISEKRKIAYNLLRTLHNHEMLLNKVIRYFITNNVLVDPIKQRLNFKLGVDKEKNEVFVGIAFNSFNEVKF